MIHMAEARHCRTLLMIEYCRVSFHSSWIWREVLPLPQFSGQMIGLPSMKVELKITIQMINFQIYNFKCQSTSTHKIASIITCIQSNLVLHPDHRVLGALLLHLLEPHQEGDEEVGSQNDHHLRLRHVLHLLVQDFRQGDVEKGPRRYAHEEGHHKGPLADQAAPGHQSQHVHRPLHHDHDHHPFLAVPLLPVHQSQSQALRPLVHQNGARQTQHAQSALLKPHRQALEERVDRHARLQDERLPVHLRPIFRVAFLGGSFDRPAGFEFVVGGRIGLFSEVDAFFLLPGFSDEADFVLVVVGLSDENFVDVHDDHEGGHGDDEGEGEVAVLVEAAGGGGHGCAEEVLVEAVDGLGDDVNHGDGEEESPRESHGQVHDAALSEAGQFGNHIAEDRDFQEEHAHQHYFNHESWFHLASIFCPTVCYNIYSITTSCHVAKHPKLTLFDSIWRQKLIGQKNESMPLSPAFTRERVRLVEDSQGSMVPSIKQEEIASITSSTSQSIHYLLINILSQDHWHLSLQ